MPGAKQRRRVYGLTAKGKERASSIRDLVLSKIVIKDGEKVILSSLRKGGQMTLDLLSHVDEGLVFHTNPVVSPVSNPEGTASLDAQARESSQENVCKSLGRWENYQRRTAIDH